MEDKKVGKIHKNHRERMKKIFLETGIESFSDVEKLEFLLFFAISRKDTNIIAHNLIEKFGHFNQKTLGEKCAKTMLKKSKNN